MKKKVCIVNAHWSNRGDEAALRPIIDMLLDNQLDVTVIFKDRKSVNSVPYKDISFFSAQFLPQNEEEIINVIDNHYAYEMDDPLVREISTICESDLIVYSPGGAVISSSFWWRKQLEYLTPFICAQRCNIPIVVAAPSVGPFKQDSKCNIFIRDCLNSAQHIIVREKISQDYLSTIGVVKVATTIDTAFADDFNEYECSKALCRDTKLVEFTRKCDKIVAITLSDFSWNVRYKEKENLIKEAEDVMVEFISYLRNQGYGILLIPQLFGNQNDSDYLQSFVAENTMLLDYNYDTYFQQFIISKCFAVVGMRYHSNIFAAKCGVPFIAIGYEEKMEGFMEQWELTDYLIRIEELKFDELLVKWSNLILQQDKYRNILRGNREIWREKAKQTLETIMSCLYGG